MIFSVIRKEDGSIFGGLCFMGNDIRLETKLVGSINGKFNISSYQLR